MNRENLRDVVIGIFAERYGTILGKVKAQKLALIFEKNDTWGAATVAQLLIATRTTASRERTNELDHLRPTVGTNANILFPIDYFVQFV